VAEPTAVSPAQNRSLHDMIDATCIRLRVTFGTESQLHLSLYAWPVDELRKRRSRQTWQAAMSQAGVHLRPLDSSSAYGSARMLRLAIPPWPAARLQNSLQPANSSMAPAILAPLTSRCRAECCCSCGAAGCLKESATDPQVDRSRIDFSPHTGSGRQKTSSGRAGTAAPGYSYRRRPVSSATVSLKGHLHCGFLDG
jgi:hypothetical protein